jgi:hypothetical protein
LAAKERKERKSGKKTDLSAKNADDPWGARQPGKPKNSVLLALSFLSLFVFFVFFVFFCG